MDRPEGAGKTGDVRLGSDRRVRLEFHGSKISSDGGLASWVHERHPLRRHISNRQLEDLLAAKLVTPQQVRAAGMEL